MRDVIVFLGHDFFGTETQRKNAYRQAVTEACEEANRNPQVISEGLRFTVVYGDTKHEECEALFDRIHARRQIPLSGRYWDEIRAMIEASDYTIFDLTYNRVSEPVFFNANVLLEYGVAIGLGKQTAPIGRDFQLFSTQLSNVHGHAFYVYNTLDDLRRITTHLLTRYLYLQSPRRSRRQT